MYTLNITVKVDPEIEEAWIQWQKEHHLPNLLSTNCFSSYKFYHLIGHDENDGKTFVIQLFSPSADAYDLYLSEYDEKMKQEALQKYPNRFYEFRSLLAEV